MMVNIKYSWYFMHIRSIFTQWFISLYSLEMALLVYSSFIRVATSGFRIIPFSLVVLFVVRNEEKPVEILIYSSFRRVATSGFRNFSVATSS